MYEREMGVIEAEGLQQRQTQKQRQMVMVRDGETDRKSVEKERDSVTDRNTVERERW